DLAGVRVEAAAVAGVQLSTDSQFTDKVRDIVGLYRNPPEAAVVLCVDEKARIQALDRTAPVLPLMPGVPERRTHDYLRSGTTDLYAALAAPGARDHGDDASASRRGVRRFLNLIDRTVPADLDLHVVLDNSSARKTPAIQRWLVRHPRFRLHFTPTYSSWLVLVERCFAELTTNLIKRKSHRSVRDLIGSIRSSTNNWNDDPGPFLWHKPADEILQSVAAYCQRIQRLGTLAGCARQGRRGARPAALPTAPPARVPTLAPPLAVAPRQPLPEIVVALREARCGGPRTRVTRRWDGPERARECFGR